MKLVKAIAAINYVGPLVQPLAVVVARDLNFRGDTDESWMKMEGFLARTLASATRGPGTP